MAAPPDTSEPTGEPSAWEPVITHPDPMSEQEWRAWLEASGGEEEPWWLLEVDPDPQDDPPPADWEVAGLLAGCRQATEDRARAEAAAARLGTAAGLGALPPSSSRRGPGQPGSEEAFAGEHPGRAALFAAGLLCDVMPGCQELAGFADEAAGADDAFDGVTDEELLGVLCAWDRVEAHAAARKCAATAELIRRRPGAGCEPEGPARMPRVWDEFTSAELCAVLAGSRHDADALLDLAHNLEVKLPATKAAFRDGVIGREKAEIISRATALLTAEEAREAEGQVLGRAGWLTPGGLRSAMGRAVIGVAPGKARKRREKAAREARLERWAEVSGNAGLAGRELPPALVLAADQKITALARQLRKAGLEGSLDELRAKAYLDLLLGTDSRPGHGGAGAGRQDGAGLPPGFAGQVHLTITLATLTGLADRPAEIPGIGPIDPALARDLAGAAARNPRSTWCVTVTDEQGHAIGHGCARPEPRNHRKRQARHGRPGPRDGRDPPREDGPGFAFTATDPPWPPGGYGTWRLATGGERDLLVTLEPIGTDPCDHRYQARGHDPGIKLRHLTQIRHAICTGPGCRRPAWNCDFEHNIPYEAGGRTCTCNGGPKCRRDHRLKQDPRWKVDQLPDGTFRWTTPSGRQYTSEPTRYPV